METNLKADSVIRLATLMSHEHAERIYTVYSTEISAPGGVRRNNSASISVGDAPDCKSVLANLLSVR
ncbi:Uncharacterised protein [Escherichia coli]|jgi:hypothetical protein|nr:Uncharacterised protein [Escherichia coli]